MHLENILNAADSTSHEAFVKEQLYFTTTTDKHIATILDNHNKDFTIALVTAIRQLLAIANKDKTKRNKQLKKVLDKYAATTASTASSKGPKHPSPKSPIPSTSTNPIGNQLSDAKTTISATIGNTTADIFYNCRSHTTKPAHIYPESKKETEITKPFP